MGRPKGSKDGHRAITPKACERCGTVRYYSKPYIAKVRRFCSHEYSRTPQVPRQCEQCYETFSQPPAQRPQRFCSRQCRQVHDSQCPPYQILHRLYCVEKLSSPAIAAQYGVEKITVLRWLKTHNINRRRATNGLAHHGRTEPTKEQLYWLLHVARENLDEIGKRFGITKQAIRQWLIKLEVPRPPLFTLPEKEVRRLYERENVSLVDIGKMHSVGADVIKRLCVEYNIPIKVAGWNRQLIEGRDGHRVRSLYEKRVCDWLTDHSIAHEYEPPLFGTTGRADFFARGCYIEVWGVQGSSRYDRRKAKKIALYAKHKATLIQIPYWRFGKHSWYKPLKPLLPALALAS